MAKTTGRKPKYTGILLEPLGYIRPIAPQNVLRWGDHDLLKQSVRTWMQLQSFFENPVLHQERLRAIMARLDALCKFFDIDRTQRGWPRDLVLRLAQRHEPKSSHGLSLASLFARHSIDPYEQNADLTLVYRLAEKYVPGFSTKMDPTIKISRFSRIELLSIVSAVSAIRYKLEQQGVKPSDSKVASILLNEKTCSKVLNPNLAAFLTSIISGKGNRRIHSGNQQSSLSQRALTGYLRQMRQAANNFTDRTPSDVLQRIICKVASDSEAGRMLPDLDA